MDANLANRITVDPGKRSGKPSIRGLRITVSDVLEYLASGITDRHRRFDSDRSLCF